MKTTDTFKATIKAYLDKRAESDELFAVSYAKENKNIDECCNFIMQQVQKSGCNGFADEEIYGMAVHFYDEDNIEIGKPMHNAQVAVNHVVVLTAEEKEKARQDAMQKAQDEAYAKLTSKKVAPKKEVPEVQQASLF